MGRKGNSKRKAPKVKTSVADSLSDNGAVSSLTRSAGTVPALASSKKSSSDTQKNSKKR